MQRLIVSGLCTVLFTASAFGTNINLSAKATANNSNSITVAPNTAVPFKIEGTLTDNLNEGLALIGFDLHFTGGALAANTIVTPTGTVNCSNPMPNFVKNLGITNPAGYGGTLIGGDLIQVGGGQNTINNTVDNAPFPIGTVLPGVAQPAGCGTAVIANGSITAPAANGTYTLQISNVFANVIRDGETGAVFWATEAAGVGTITNLTITVAACQTVSAVTVAAPADQQSLWRSERNIIRITFNNPLTQVPAPGEILIQELLAGGQYGPDLSAGFTFALESGGTVLRIRETATTGGPLEHRKWYGVRNNASDCINDFILEYVVQVGDADANRFVTPVDVGQINASPTGVVADNSRFDIDGNGFRTALDVGLANASQGGLPAKPSGH